MTRKFSIQKLLLFSIAILFSCNRPETPNVVQHKNPAQEMKAPSFNEDSAYFYTERQVSFGPRVPGTEAHESCAKYLAERLSASGFEIIVQQGIVTAYNKKKFNLKNIIAAYRPDASKRILLCSHWDTRPFADRDSVNRNLPFDGANDGASSTAVLLEIARQISISKPMTGIDIILFDLEDYGDPDGTVSDSWCLGSQYWAKNLHRQDYYAQYGILLDMVGAKNAVFPKEGSSVKYAPSIVNKVWNIAARAGYSKFFIDEITPPTTDDHVYINEYANIPCIDIVHYDPDKSDYMPCHHRHCDNMSIIDKQSLKAAGQVVLEVIFSEAASL